MSNCAFNMWRSENTGFCVQRKLAAAFGIGAKERNLSARRRKFAPWLGMAILLPLTAIVLAAGAEVPATRPMPALTPAKMAELARRLEDIRPEVRHAALEDLAPAGTSELAALRSLQQGNRLRDVQAALAKRIAGLEDTLALNPSSISVDVEGGSLKDVAAALSKATGCHFDAWPPPEATDQYRSNYHYTVHMRDAAFWDVITAISAQHGIFFLVERKQRLWVVDTNDDSWKNALHVGPAAFIADLRVDRWTDTKPGGAGLRLFYQAAIDPRVRMVAHSGVLFSEAKDNLGTDLLAEKEPPRMSAFHLLSMYGTGSVHIKAPAPGAERVTLKGSMQIVVPLGEQAIEIPNAATQVGKTFHLGDKDLKLTQLENRTDNKAVYVKLEGNREGAPLNVSLINDEGTVFWAGTTLAKELYEGVGMNPPVTGSITLRLAIPRENRTVTLPFELKDLAIPQH